MYISDVDLEAQETTRFRIGAMRQLSSLRASETERLLLSEFTEPINVAPYEIEQLPALGLTLPTLKSQASDHGYDRGQQ